jgi:cytosine/adenosine deaminase-related metal-dependent hydrolase
VSALALAVLLAVSPASVSTDSTFAFVDVTVIPMDRERVLPHTTVVVRGNRIVALGPSAGVTVPADAVRIDGRGKFLIPGLAEMHAHIPGGQASDSAVERTLFLYLSGGITTIRGMLGHPRHLELRSRAARGEIASPRIYAGGPSLNGNSVPDAASAARAVVEQKRAGYDFLKIHPGISRVTFDTLAATADRVGIRFAGHVPADVGLARALEAHYATIEHMDGYVEAIARPGGPPSAFFGANLGDRLDESKLPSLVEATRKAGVWVVPTQVLLENLLGPVTVDALNQRPEMRYVAPQMIAQWSDQKRSLLADLETTPGSVDRVLELRRRLIKSLHDGGVGLLLGSDAPQTYNVPGFSIHRELEVVVGAGLTPYQALETGTRNVAAFFGTLKQAGTIEVGKRADLVLLEANPLTDIRNTGRNAGVMVRGTWYSRPDIDARLNAIAKAMAE